jgi:hypothetical protein
MHSNLDLTTVKYGMKGLSEGENEEVTVRTEPMNLID